MSEYSRIKQKFVEIYAAEPRLFRAPGRVNLIGEHTDYNDGFVLPMAIERETIIAAAPRADRKIRAFALNFNESAEFRLDENFAGKKGFWLNYIEGVARVLESEGFGLTGADLLISSNIPLGSGLSSSAALEVCAGLALSEISGVRVDRKTLALVGQQAEHDYVGAKVGIMDQFISVNAEANTALLLDCRSLEYKHLPFDNADYVVAICDTKVKHDIATSGYNERRAECERATELLKNFYPQISKLRDVSIENLAAVEDQMPPVIYRRARHVVTENERTLQAAQALNENNFAGFGQLMYASHESLRRDFEVSCAELDALVEFAAQIRGVAGARMTGGGFGGSTVNLVEKKHLPEFTEIVADRYNVIFKTEPKIIVSKAAGRAEELENFSIAD